MDFFAALSDTIPQVQWRREMLAVLATLHLIRAKRLCYRRMKLNSTLWSRYKHLHNEVCSMTRRDYKNFVDTITSNLHGLQKPFWNWINKLKACCSPISPLVHNNNTITSDSA